MKDSLADADVLKLARLGLASPVSGEYQQLQTALLSEYGLLCLSVHVSFCPSVRLTQK